MLVCYVHPGVVRTDAFRNMPLLFKILAYTVFRVLTKVWAIRHQKVLDVIKPLIKLDCIANYLMFHFTFFVVFDNNARLLSIISYQFCCLIFALRRFNQVCTFFFFCNRISNFLVSNIVERVN